MAKINGTELAQWVLDVHGVRPQTFEHPNAKPEAIGHDGLWWAVISTEAAEWSEPDSVWPSRKDAELRVLALNLGRYPSWHVAPAVATLWMRNELHPETT